MLCCRSKVEISERMLYMCMMFHIIAGKWR